MENLEKSAFVCLSLLFHLFSRQRWFQRYLCTFKMVHLFTMTDRLGIVGLHYIKKERSSHVTEKRRGNVCAVGEIIPDFMQLIFGFDKK